MSENMMIALDLKEWGMKGEDKRERERV
jgi:hypothetical protein